MADAILTIASKNYSSWCLRGWLLCRMAGLEFEERKLASDDPSIRAELLLQSSTILLPNLAHGEIKVWDVLAIGEYLNETFPGAGLLPADPAARAHCRAVSGEMHSGFANLRSALPMNLKGHFPKFKIWTNAKADIDRVAAIWRDCMARYGGPYLFGDRPNLADAMYAPVCTRFKTYDVTIDRTCTDYCETVFALPAMMEWREAALAEPDAVEELEAEF